MNKNDTIVIERAGNGFMVRQHTHTNGTYKTTDVLVFNNMGWASSAGDGTECLLTWIERHFRDEPPKT